MEAEALNMGGEEIGKRQQRQQSGVGPEKRVSIPTPLHSPGSIEEEGRRQGERREKGGGGGGEKSHSGLKGSKPCDGSLAVWANRLSLGEQNVRTKATKRIMKTPLRSRAVCRCREEGGVRQGE